MQYVAFTKSSNSVYHIVANNSDHITQCGEWYGPDRWFWHHASLATAPDSRRLCMRCQRISEARQRRATDIAYARAVRIDVAAVRPGDIVLHPRFGRGLVVGVERLKSSTSIEVQFDDGYKRTLDSGFARLKAA